jgi:hypothetical protein
MTANAADETIDFVLLDEAAKKLLGYYVYRKFRNYLAIHWKPQTARVSSQHEAVIKGPLDTPTSKPYSLTVHVTGATAKDRVLTEIAERLFWWRPPKDALEDQARFVAQVMALGTDRDVKCVEAQLGSEVFDRILDHPPPGLFSPRRWNYWHVRQHRNPVPSLPQRFSSSTPGPLLLRRTLPAAPPA